MKSKLHVYYSTDLLKIPSILKIQLENLPTSCRSFVITVTFKSRDFNIEQIWDTDYWTGQFVIINVTVWHLYDFKTSAAVPQVEG